jgi:adenylate cyclase
LVGPRIPPPGVVIAAIDEDTIRQAGAFPLPREVLAKIVRGLARYNPQVICVDMLLLVPASPIPTGNLRTLCTRSAA